MTPHDEDTRITLPAACGRAMAALEADPLEPGPEAEAHLRGCAPCAEARVMLLAQEDAPVPLVPAGYFQALPGRVLRKLPAKAAPKRRLPGWGWAAAAALLMGTVGLGGFLAGRANTAIAPAEVAQTHAEPSELASDRAALPFHDRDEELEELQTLSPDEMQALVDRLQAPAPAKR